jgi:ectoine hydroxylase-related dioxygenase (phytanoyl-CoA dioxygenase family)
MESYPPVKNTGTVHDKYGRAGIFEPKRSNLVISRIIPSETERLADSLGSETVEQALRSFRLNGALIIENIVDAAIIVGARRAFSEGYSHHLNGSNPKNVLMVGAKRLLITIKLEPPFDNPRLFANPYLLPVIGAELGDGFVLGAFGIVCSLPSAPAQKHHHDGGVLFSSGIDYLLPATAITVGIPLLEMNEVHGTTALWPGSHRDGGRLEEESIKPIVREGSCMLWDFRLWHAGTPNRSALPRPLLYLTYCRPWFLEPNFDKRTNPKQRPLLATKNFLSSLSEQHQRLLVRAQEV